MIVWDLLLSLPIALENIARLWLSRGKISNSLSLWNMAEWFSWISTWIQTVFIFCPYFAGQPLVKLLILFLSYWKLLRIITVWRYLVDTFIGRKLGIIATSTILAWKDFLLIFAGTVTFSCCVGLYMFYCDNSLHQFASVSDSLTWAFATVVTVGIGINSFSVTGLLCTYAGLLMTSLVMHTLWAYCEVAEMSLKGSLRVATLPAKENVGLS